MEIVCSGMTHCPIKDWRLLHIFIQTLLQTMALFVKRKISNIIKQWKNVWNALVHQVHCLLDSPLLSRVLHCKPTNHTGELGQSSFSRSLGSFLHICVDIFLYERKRANRKEPKTWGNSCLLAGELSPCCRNPPFRQLNV